MKLNKALKLRKAKYISKKRNKKGEWEYKYADESKISKKKTKHIPFNIDKKGRSYYKLTGQQLRNTNINSFKSGDSIIINNKYVIHLKQEKYKGFSMESSVEDYNTYKFIDPYVYPVYIREFLDGRYKK